MSTTVTDSAPARVADHGDLAPPARQRRGFSLPEIAFLTGVPLLWGILLLFHPTGDDSYATVKDQVSTWQTVHIGTMLFIPLMAGVLFLLLRGVEGVAATVSRIALGFFSVFYLAWEVLVGIGTGLLVDDVNRLAASQRETGIELVKPFVDSQINAVFSAIGSAGWVIAAVAAAVALFRRARGPPSVAVALLLVLSAPLIAIHVTPFGPVGLTLFIAAVLLVVRAESAAPVAAIRSGGSASVRASGLIVPAEHHASGDG